MSNYFEPTSIFSGTAMGCLSDRAYQVGSPSSALDMRCFNTGEASPTGVLDVHGGITSSITGTTGSTGGPNFLTPLINHASEADVAHLFQQTEHTKSEYEVEASMDGIFARLLDSDSANQSDRIETVNNFDHFTVTSDSVCDDQGLFESRDIDMMDHEQGDNSNSSCNSISKDTTMLDFLHESDSTHLMNLLVGNESNDKTENEERSQQPNKKKQRRGGTDNCVNENSKKPRSNLKITVPTATSTDQNKRRATLVREKTARSEDATSDTARRWQVSFVAPQFKDKVQVDVTSKTRCEKPMSCVPDTLYSSLKYEVRQRVSGTICKDQQFLLGKITVIDGHTGKEVLKDEQSILKGIVEGALTRPVKLSESNGDESNSSVYFEGVLKCQFNSVSFYHKKAQFRWQISYFSPDDLENPVLKCLSAPFLVLARKASTGKRKRREKTSSDNNAAAMNSSTVIAPTTTVKNGEDTTESITLDGFSLQLESLLELAQHLPDRQRAAALHMMQERVSRQFGNA